ncbi:ADP-ribosylglycohydrolase family protein [uncultured Microscilla sp.]|uniref:ADP-ribosylglycohydrolase family protein n=1 Tax=uncultured Microscilla sp. TaxID=432653 RepID=UPI00263446AE|nr:ADP-ribosylglycohydrolase family protein [uncultured Microscilla sp.]
MIRFQDILLGIAIGDAFGAGVEFQDRHWIQQNVDFSQLVNARSSIAAHLSPLPPNFPPINAFTQNYVAWSYTDDTEMTIGLVKALMSGKTFTPDVLYDCFRQEYQLGTTQNGFGRNGHGSMQWVFDGKMTIDEVRAFQQNRPYPGNAPVSRVVPIGLLPMHLVTPYALVNANATHPHPKAHVASILVAQATHFLLKQEGSPVNLMGYCQQQIKGLDAETENLLAQADALPVPKNLQTAHYEVLCGTQPITAPRFLPGIYGLPSDAMLTAISTVYILKHAQNAFEGLQYAINLGGDVDSLASVCTGILGGKFGLGSLPNFMLNQVENRSYLLEVAKDFDDWL